MESSNCDIEFFHIACWHHHEKKESKIHAQKHSLQGGHLPVLNMALSPYGRSYFHGDPGSPKLRMGAWNLNTILRSLGTPQSSSENMTIDTLGGGPKATHLQRSFWGRPTCTLRISRDGSPQTSLFFGGRSNCLRPHRTTTKLVDDSFPNTPWEWYLPTKTIR